MHGLVTSPHRRRQSARRHFRHGQRAAAVRAFTAAQLYLNNTISTLEAAAEACGSNVAYVQAAIILLRADNASLVHDVRCGRVPILQAARKAQRLVNLITAYREAKDPDRVAFARACGTEAIFNVLVAASN
jgi:predicted ATPase